MKKIYVGNLSFNTLEAELRAAFEAFGTVHSVAVISDRDTGRSRGFGFIEMDAADADTAISGMNGKELDGRSLRVNEAQEKRRSGPPRESRY